MLIECQWINGFCNSGQKPCVQNDSNREWVILRTQPKPSFTSELDLWMRYILLKKNAITKSVFIIRNVPLSWDMCFYRHRVVYFFKHSTFRSTSVSIGTSIRRQIWVLSHKIYITIDSPFLFMSLSSDPPPLSFCAKPKAKSQNLISKKITLSYGRGRTVADGGWGSENPAFQNPSSALPGTCSLCEEN